MSEKLSSTTNALNWFEIPATDITRAKKFYETIFGIEMQTIEMMGMQMAMFPTQSPHVGGALIVSENHKPSAEGSIIYLNANPDLQLVLNKMESAGGKITMPKTLIDEATGYMAFFMDTEGNLVGLHSGN
jgi:predicted enzyme related to lactoylglutathione lyase